MSMQVDRTAPQHAESGNAVKLILAWGLVGIPLLWGVWNTLVSAVPLFR